MDDKNRKNEYPQDPWDQPTYQTGRTRPPKNHGGCIAVLLVAAIFICGIASVFGFFNIRFREPDKADKEESAPMSFSLASDPTEEIATAFEPEHTIPGDASVNIQQSPPSVENIPQEGGLSLQQIYAQTIDSVVSIRCRENGSVSSGTGVVLSKDGYIVTNCHVVEDAQYIEVVFTGDIIAEARIVGTDAVSDLAVLWVSDLELTPAEFGDSDALRVGDAVVAIGDPLGIELRGTMTDGIVSAINRNITTGGRTMTLIQTNAALNSGNSGGPLLNCYGQVIGINTMKIGDTVSSAGVEGLGFAIPSTTVKEIVDQLIRQGYVSGRPSLGIEGEDVSILHQLYSKLPQGVYITKVSADSYVASKGISPGDILVSFNGTTVTGIEMLNTLLYSCQAGDSVPVIIYRAGQYYELSIILDEAH